MKRIILLLLVFISANLYAQDLSLGLRAYYPFDGNANDASGNNNDPIFNNAVLTSDADGNPNSAYHFNGTNSYMQIANSSSLNMNSTMSIALKVRPTQWYTGPCINNMMLMKGDGDYLDGNYSFRFADNITGCSAPDYTAEHFYAGDVVADTVNVQLDRWYNLVWTYDGTYSKIYINCELKNEILTSIPTFTNGYDLFIGHLNNAQYPYWLDADLDDIRIYDRALSQEEVNLYGKCAMPPTTNPLITSFNAYAVNNRQIQVDWDVYNELTVADYTVERSSIDANTGFESVTTIGNNNSGHYTITDFTALPNMLYYYRVALRNNAGVIKYSEVKTAKIINNDFYTVLYPNPTSGEVKIFINNVFSGAEVDISNSLGQTMGTKKVDANGLHPVIIDLGNFAKGTYYITIRTATQITTEKIIKL